LAAGPSDLVRHFREAFAADPSAAFRDWYRAQEELRDAGDDPRARALADDLWEIFPALSFPSPEARARFLHNLAVFLGSPGPAENLSRARQSFSEALAAFEATGDAGWEARVLHNFATALSNLGKTPADLEESVTLFGRALSWRNAEREIARGVTLHNLGLALRRLAELDPSRRTGALEESCRALAEAASIRSRHGLEEGRARSLFHRGISLLRLSEGSTDADPEARRCLEEAAREFDRLSKADSASAARGLLASFPERSEGERG
jgi:tetratricopeptide (TPR) repeat protein